MAKLLYYSTDVDANDYFISKVENSGLSRNKVNSLYAANTKVLNTAAGSVGKAVYSKSELEGLAKRARIHKNTLNTLIELLPSL